MSQTREDRMLRHYRSLMRVPSSNGDSETRTKEEVAKDINDRVWLVMARTWRMPVRQVKDLIRELRS